MDKEAKENKYLILDGPPVYDFNKSEEENEREWDERTEIMKKLHNESNQ